MEISPTDALTRGLHLCRAHLSPTGEVPVYRKVAGGTRVQCMAPLLSAIAHDALACLDPDAFQYTAPLMGLMPPRQRLWITTTAAYIRDRIRRFIAWQESSNGTWYFFGRGSGLPPDAATTACSALTFHDMSHPPGAAGMTRRVNGLMRFRSSDGRFFTYRAPSGHGYAWMTPAGDPVVGFDRIVNTYVLRFLSLSGEDVDALFAYIRHEIATGDFRTGSPDQPNPLGFFYAVARTWRLAGLEQGDFVAGKLVPAILARQNSDGDFGGLLSTALSVSALSDLGYSGPGLAKGAQYLLTNAIPPEMTHYEEFLVRGCGSAIFNTALTISALARTATDIPWR